MSFQVAVKPALIARVALASLFGLIASTTLAQSSGRTPSLAGGASRLEGTYWKAIQLAGKPTPTQDPNREAHLLFQPGRRLSGSDGCNQMSGSYQLKGDAVTFGQMAGTRMACIDAAAAIARAFQQALKNATRLRVTRERLELFDTNGRVVAAFTAGAQLPHR